MIIFFKYVCFFLNQRLASTCSCNSIASSSITGSVGPYRRLKNEFWHSASLPSTTNSTLTTNIDDLSVHDNLTEEILELENSPKIRKATKGKDGNKTKRRHQAKFLWASSFRKPKNPMVHIHTWSCCYCIDGPPGLYTFFASRNQWEQWVERKWHKNFLHFC